MPTAKSHLLVLLKTKLIIFQACVTHTENEGAEEWCTRNMAVAKT